MELKMNKQSARSLQFGKSSTRLHLAKATDSVESIKMSNLECFDRNTDDFGYLSARREWCPSKVQSSNYEGASSFKRVRAETSDLEKCKLLHIQKINVSYDEVETDSCKVALSPTYPEPSCPFELEPDSVGRLNKSLIAVTNVFKLLSDSCLYGPVAEQSRNRQSSTSTIVDIEQEKMADDGSCDQSGKTPKNKKNTITKLFNRLSLSKKQHDELNHPSNSNLEEQISLRERSDTTSSRNISYASIAKPDSSSEQYYAVSKILAAATLNESPDSSEHHYAAPKILASATLNESPDSSEHHYAVPKILAAASIDEPPNQSLVAKQHRLLRRLHSTLNEASAIVEEFLLLY